MSFRPLSRLLLAFAFVAGQFFAIAHATQHELSATDSQSCETCAVAHGAGAAPAAPAFDVAVLPCGEIPQPVCLADPSLRPTRRTRSRAPPVSLN